MTRQERQQRADEKRLALLDFLASGEVWTSAEIAGDIWGLAKTGAFQTLQGMVRDGLLKTESHLIVGRKTSLYGITPHGLLLTDLPLDRPIFELGRTSATAVRHHIDGQRVRLALERQGWSAWQAGKLLYNQGMLAVPDAIVTDPQGRPVAVEIERNIKTLKRYKQLFSAHIRQISGKRYHRVLYVTPDGLAPRLQRLFDTIAEVDTPEGKLSLTEAHRARFVVRDMSQVMAGGEQ